MANHAARMRFTSDLLNPVAFAQLRRAIRAMQDEHRLAVSDDMGGAMIVRIDHYLRLLMRDTVGAD